MKTLAIRSLSAFAVAASLAAQGGLSTATGYAVYADAGTGVVQGVPAGTPIGNAGLQIRAFDGGSSTTVPSAVASTAVHSNTLSTSAGVRSVTVQETGAAVWRPAQPAVAGTSDDPRLGGQAPHALAWVVPARPGTTGAVVVTWDATASLGAFAAASVDVDGDGSPDFAQRVTNGTLQLSQTFRVVAGPNGFELGVETAGNAGVAITPSSLTGARYDAQLDVVLRIGGTVCTFTNFGPECAGRLDGYVPSASSPGFVLRLTQAAPRAIAVLAIGDRLRTPLPLPGTRCELLVYPMVTLPGQTDGQGQASWQFPQVAAALTLTISFQAVTLDLLGTPQLGSSNGTTLVCQ
ncbi:MAG: hypothetical protein IPM29_31420 [Planctomycetes bacterium]|nr:hypothetical protein [Planctomycetota bacterium]